MRTSAPALLPLFRSELQARLLTLLFLDAGRGYATSDLREATGASPASLHRELARLEAAGLLEVERVGRTKLHRAAEDSPLFEPLRTLSERTLGIEESPRNRLEPIAGIELAAIYGSLAEGRVGPGSDIRPPRCRRRRSRRGLRRGRRHGASRRPGDPGSSSLNRVDRMRRIRHTVFYDAGEISTQELEQALADAATVRRRRAVRRS